MGCAGRPCGGPDLYGPSGSPDVFSCSEKPVEPPPLTDVHARFTVGGFSRQLSPSSVDDHLSFGGEDQREGAGGSQNSRRPFAVTPASLCRTQSLG